MSRKLSDRLTRKILRSILPYPKRLKPLLKISQLLKPFLPAPLKNKVPKQQTQSILPNTEHARKMIALGGCAQSVIKPGTNSAAATILDKLGISLVTPTAAGCCGAVSYHLNKNEEGLAFMRHNIDTWWPLIESGYEGIDRKAHV